MYKEVKGNIFDHERDYDVLVHGCNCYCTMGSGIARTIRELYPEAYEADCQTKKGDRSKIGSFSYYIHPRKNLTIINAYTQYNYYPRNIDHFVYEGFAKICNDLYEQYKHKMCIAMPMIGAGLAGGNWNRIKKIIQDNIKDVNVTIYYI